MIDRRRLLKLSAAATLAPGIPCSAVAQSSWPNKPVRILIPFTPGGGADTIARFVALKMTEVLGQQFIVESKPGPSDHSVLSLITPCRIIGGRRLDRQVGIAWGMCDPAPQ